MAAKDYPLAAAVPAANSTSTPNHVWAFDLGKASIGEAVRVGKDFRHRESLLIPAEFADTKPAATKRRMMRTREAHKEREKWLEQVWDAAGLEEHRPKKKRWNKEKKCFEPADTDYRLKREFAPALQRTDRRTGKKRTTKDSYPNGVAKLDGAPAAKPEDFQVCYTSSLLRIKLLCRDPELKEWQIYKALHSAIQKRGYARVPWAAKDAARSGVTPEEQEKKEQEELKKKEPKYQQTVEAWNKFLLEVLDKHGLSHREFAYPCYYDAYRIGLWKPDAPHDTSHLFPDHRASSTRNIRFHREDLEAEILRLAENADKLLDGKLEQARGALLEKFKIDCRRRIEKINERRRIKNACLPPSKRKLDRPFPKFEKLAATAAEYLLCGPAGFPPDEAQKDFALYLAFRRQAGLRPGTADDWMGALGQKIPRFDNRIIDKCALIPRLNVCKAGAKLGADGAAPDPDSLLYCEVMFLMKLKNVRVMPNVRPLTPEQIGKLLAEKRAELAGRHVDPKRPADTKKLAKCYSLSAPHWRKIGQKREFEFKPHSEYRQINLPLPLPDTMEGFASAFAKRLSEVRVLRAESVEALSAEQIETLLEAKRKELRRISLDPSDPKYAETVTKVYSYDSVTAWSEVGERPGFGFWPAPNHEVIEGPKAGGRSRLSRPALKIMRELILSGQSGQEFRRRLLRRDDTALLLKLGTRAKENGQTVVRPLVIFDDSNDSKVNAENGRKGLLVSDLAFLDKMRKAGATEGTWDDLFIPNEKLERMVEDLQGESGDTSLSIARQEVAQRDRCALADRKGCRPCASERAINKLIGQQNDPIVRQRLRFFWDRLKELEKEHGEPSRIVLEFAREDFLGKKAKEDWKKFNDKKRELNRKAAERGGSERDQLKFKLWQDQGGECVYGIRRPDGTTHRGLPLPDMPGWETLEIDHIVPTSEGGPDSYLNYVLTFGEIANGPKSKLTPYEWFSRDRPTELDGYIGFVRGKLESKDEPGLSRKKIALLTRPDAKDLVQKYTALAETAWISRLAQTIVRLHFGWPLDHQPGTERVLTLTGGQTAQFRREFRLNTLLGPKARADVSVEQISKQEEERAAIEIQDLLMKENTKNRVDPRHHALDAMVLTLIPEWRHYQAKIRERWRAKKTGEQPKPEIMERPTPFFDHHRQSKDGKPSHNSNSIRQKFAGELEKTHARLVAFERPRLEETHYAKKKVPGEINKPLDEIAFVTEPDSTVRRFDSDKLRRWTKQCQNPSQKAALEAFLSNTPSGETWEQFKAANRRLFSGGQVRVSVPGKTTRYTKRVELRLIAFDTQKEDMEFKKEHVRNDVERIDTTLPGMAHLKAALEAYLSTNPYPDELTFTTKLKELCQHLPGRRKIILEPLASQGEEPESKRRGESRDPENFGHRKVPLKFDAKKVVKKLGDICDPWVREQIATEFHIRGKGRKAESRDFKRKEWERFCENLHKPTKDGKPGPRVLKVTLLAGDAAEEQEDEEIIEPSSGSSASDGETGAQTLTERDEFVESTKSPKAFLKGASHKGYYLYLDDKGDWERWPVFAHEGRKSGHEEYEKRKRALLAVPGSQFREIGFLQTGCQVELMEATRRPVKLGRKKEQQAVNLPKGFYRLNTLNKTGQTKLTTQNGDIALAQVDVFIEAGLRRVD